MKNSSWIIARKTHFEIFPFLILAESEYEGSFQTDQNFWNFFWTKNFGTFFRRKKFDLVRRGTFYEWKNAATSVLERTDSFRKL